MQRLTQQQAGIVASVESTMPVNAAGGKTVLVITPRTPQRPATGGSVAPHRPMSASSARGDPAVLGPGVYDGGSASSARQAALPVGGYPADPCLAVRTPAALHSVSLVARERNRLVMLGRYDDAAALPLSAHLPPSTGGPVVVTTGSAASPNRGSDVSPVTATTASSTPRFTPARPPPSGTRQLAADAPAMRHKQTTTSPLPARASAVASAADNRPSEAPPLPSERIGLPQAVAVGHSTRRGDSILRTDYQKSHMPHVDLRQTFRDGPSPMPPARRPITARLRPSGTEATTPFSGDDVRQSRFLDVNDFNDVVYQIPPPPPPPSTAERSQPPLYLARCRYAILRQGALTFEWRDCAILDYAAESDTYLIEFAPTTATERGEHEDIGTQREVRHKYVRPLLVQYPGETSTQYDQRVKRATVARDTAEAMLRYRQFAESMHPVGFSGEPIAVPTSMPDDAMSRILAKVDLRRQPAEAADTPRSSREETATQRVARWAVEADNSYVFGCRLANLEYHSRNPTWFAQYADLLSLPTPTSVLQESSIGLQRALGHWPSSLTYRSIGNEEGLASTELPASPFISAPSLDRINPLTVIAERSQPMKQRQGFLAKELFPVAHSGLYQVMRFVIEKGTVYQNTFVVDAELMAIVPPVELAVFSQHQDQFNHKSKRTIADEWLVSVNSNALLELSHVFDIYQDNVAQYEQSRAARFFRLLNLLLAAQVQSIVKRTVTSLTAFLKRLVIRDEIVDAARLQLTPTAAAESGVGVPALSARRDCVAPFRPVAGCSAPESIVPAPLRAPPGSTDTGLPPLPSILIEGSSASSTVGTVPLLHLRLLVDEGQCESVAEGHRRDGGEDAAHGDGGRIRFDPPMADVAQCLQRMYDRIFETTDPLEGTGSKFFPLLHLSEAQLTAHYQSIRAADEHITACRDLMRDMLDQHEIVTSAIQSLFDPFAYLLQDTAASFAGKFKSNAAAVIATAVTSAPVASAVAMSPKGSKGKGGKKVAQVGAGADHGNEETVAAPPSMNDYATTCDALAHHIDVLQRRTVNDIMLPLLQVDCSPVKQALIKRARAFTAALLERLIDETSVLIDDLDANYQGIRTRLTKDPTSPEELRELRRYVDGAPTLMRANNDLLDHITDRLQLLSRYGYMPGQATFERFWASYSWPRKIGAILDDLPFRMQGYRAQFLLALREAIAVYQNDLADCSREVAKLSFEEDEQNDVKNLTTVEQLQARLASLTERATMYNQHEAIFQQPTTRWSSTLRELEAAFEPHAALWKLVVHSRKIEGWLDATIEHLVHRVTSETIVSAYQAWHKEAVRLAKALALEAPIVVVKAVRERLDAFRPIIPLIVAVAKKSLLARRRHVQRLAEVLGVERLDSFETKTITDLIKLGALNHLSRIDEVADHAEKEEQISEKLNKMRSEWDKIQFKYVAFETTALLKDTDPIRLLLDDHLARIASMLSNPFAVSLMNELRPWEARLACMSRTLDAWLQCQVSLQYLYPIFTAGDIAKSLPMEADLFADVLTHWQDVMVSVSKFSLVLVRCTDEKLHPTFVDDLVKLDRLMQALSRFLDEKRGIFPRFFFLSNDDLVAILSETRKPERVQPHLQKCFEGIHSLDFVSAEAEVVDPSLSKPSKNTGSGGNNNNAAATIAPSTLQPSSEVDHRSIVAMRSAEGERVTLNEPISPWQFEGTEKWLLKLESCMFATVKALILNANEDYVRHPQRSEWTLLWPGQIVLAVAHLQWTAFVEQSIVAHSIGDCARVVKTQLDDLVLLVRGSLTPVQHMTLQALITLEVHSRDITTSLADTGITKLTDFSWLCQLRYYLNRGPAVTPQQANTPSSPAALANAALKDPSIGCIMVHQTMARIRYGNEYLGNTSRLVVTPLTDRCYRTLTSAYHLNLGGAPEGPAGTGKTETTKDLAKALGKQCIVFNCGEHIQATDFERLLRGLASCGAWGCFDEFNRIEAQVLSIIAQQVLTIQLAVAQQRSEFLFEGKLCSLKEGCSICVTMNPGYAGRSNLPDNLKALFRPVAMMVPDYAMIAETFLFSCGFLEASTRSSKLVTAYKLCSEQLSSQNHYDYGMRAVKAVLGAAQLLRTELSSQHASETGVMIRALLDVNMPKFLATDATLFRGIIADLFGVSLAAVSLGTGLTTASLGASSQETEVIPQRDYDSLRSAMKEVCDRDQLMPHAVLLGKALQLCDTIFVRHGVMLVGQALGGKKSCVQVLSRAMTFAAHRSLDDDDDEDDTDGADPDGTQVVTRRRAAQWIPVVTATLNPKAVTLSQLFGCSDATGQDWADGVLSRLFRDFSLPSLLPERRWLVLDGPVDAVWVENMNTVLDDNKKLCLASGDIIRMSSSMTLMFVVQDLASASPATVSRCGMVFFEPVELGVAPFVAAAKSKLRLAQPAIWRRECAVQVVDAVLAPMLSIRPAANGFVSNIRKLLASGKFIGNLTDTIVAHQTLRIFIVLVLEAFDGIPVGVDASPAVAIDALSDALLSQYLCGLAVVAMIQGVGSLLPPTAAARSHFAAMLSDELSLAAAAAGMTVPLPTPDESRTLARGSMAGTLDDGTAAVASNSSSSVLLKPRDMFHMGFLVPKSLLVEGTFVSWLDVVSNQGRAIDSDEVGVEGNRNPAGLSTYVDTVQLATGATRVVFRDVLVPTIQTCRDHYLLSCCARHGVPVLLIGGTGTGKTLIVNELLRRSLSAESFASVTIQFSAKSTPNSLALMLNARLERHGVGVFRPHQGKRLVVFVDDLGMPEPDAYGTQMVAELLRQLISQEGYYHVPAPGEKIPSGSSTFKRITNLAHVAAMQPSDSGRPQVSVRLLRHYVCLQVPPNDDPDLKYIAGTFFDVIACTPGMPPTLRSLREPLVSFLVDVFATVATKFFPTPSKPHYSFNIRDMVSVFQGLLSVTGVKEDTHLISAAVHEYSRTIGDKLCTPSDRELFYRGVLEDKLRTHLKRSLDSVASMSGLNHVNVLSDLSGRRASTAAPPSSFPPDAAAALTLFGPCDQIEEQPLLYADFMPTVAEVVALEQQIMRDAQAGLGHQDGSGGEKQPAAASSRRGSSVMAFTTTMGGHVHVIPPAPIEDRFYRRIPSMAIAKRVLEGQLLLLNADPFATQGLGKMDAVVFDFFVHHVCRVSRVLRQPLGHAFLIGYSGGGKQTVARLAIYVAGLSLKTLSASRKVTRETWRDELILALRQCGEKNLGTGVLLPPDCLVQDDIAEDVNNMLNVGDVPGLFNADSVDSILQVVRPAAKTLGDASNEACWALFQSRCRSNLHFVLSMSPLGSALRNSVRKFPSLVSCTTVDWFDGWPQQGLLVVGSRLLHSKVPGREFVWPELHKPHDIQRRVEGLAALFTQMFQDSSAVVADENGTPLDVTAPFSPATYLGMYDVFAAILTRKGGEFADGKSRYSGGLDVLLETEQEIAMLQERLEANAPVIEAAAHRTAALIAAIDKEAAVADDERASIATEEVTARVIADEAQRVKADCEANLAVAMPALNAAMAAVSKIDKKDLVELKSMSNPPEKMKRVIEAVCVVLDVKPREVKDPATGKKELDYWTPMKTKTMADPEAFREMLLKYDKENMREDIFAVRIKPYVADKSFRPEAVKDISAALVGICQWVVAMEVFYRVYKIVKPKKQQYAAAEATYARAAEVLAGKKLALDAIEARVAGLRSQLETTNASLDALQQEREVSRVKLGRARKLLSCLSGEKDRYRDLCAEMSRNLHCLAGDASWTAAMTTFTGHFPVAVRRRLAQLWVKRITVDEGMSMSSEPMSLKKFLASDIDVLQWILAGLPPDAYSIENATMIERATAGVRSPFLIDPDGQGCAWLKALYRSTQATSAATGSPSSAVPTAGGPPAASSQSLVVIKADSKHLVEELSSAIQLGQAALIQGCGEKLEPALVPIVTRRITWHQGKGSVSLGGIEVAYNPKFRLYLSTALPGPSFPPEVSTAVTLVSFIITADGLVEQALGRAIQVEERELEDKRVRYVENSAASKRQLIDLEDAILETLSTQRQTLLDGDAVIEQLENSKKTALTVEQRLAEIDVFQKAFEKTRIRFKPLAKRVSQLYEAVSSLSRMSSMYAFSLTSILRLFGDALAATESDQGKGTLVSMAHPTLAGAERGSKMHRSQAEKERRVAFVLETFLTRLHVFVSRSLLAKDQLLLSVLLAVAMAEVPPAQIRQFLSSSNQGQEGQPAPAGAASKPTYVSVDVWKSFAALSRDVGGHFARLLYDAEMDQDREFSRFLHEQHLRLPMSYAARLAPFEQLLLVQAARPDLLTAVARAFVRETCEHPPPLAAENGGSGPPLAAAGPSGRVGGGNATSSGHISLGALDSLLENATAKNLTATLEYHCDPTQPVLLVLSPGADPLTLVRNAAAALQMTERLDTLSLGIGMGSAATTLLSDAKRYGRWVLLQNLHLFKSWLRALDNWLDDLAAEGRRNLNPLYRVFLTTMPSEDVPVAIISRCVKLVVEPPIGVKSNLEATLRTFPLNDATFFQHPRSRTWKPLVLALCSLHVVLLERRAYGSLGWNTPYQFTEFDFVLSLKLLHTLLWPSGLPPPPPPGTLRPSQAAKLAAAPVMPLDDVPSVEPVPFEALTYMLSECYYGGRVTDSHDRRLLSTLVRTTLNDSVLVRTWQPTFLVDAHNQPLKVSLGNGNYVGAQSGLESLSDVQSSQLISQLSYEEMLTMAAGLPEDAPPEVVGLHGNAGARRTRSEGDELVRSLRRCLGSAAQSQRIAGAESGALLARQFELQVESLSAKLPRRFDIDELATKFPLSADGPPMNTVLIQEVRRFNRLLDVISSSLAQLLLALRGRSVMSAELDTLRAELERGDVPNMWASASYPTALPVGGYVDDLVQRLSVFAAWASTGEPRAVFWLGGFFFPHSFLTGVLQIHCRAQQCTIDTLSWRVEVQSQAAQMSVPPAEGCYVGGLYLDGCAWDDHRRCLVDSRAGVVHAIQVTPFPVVHLVPTSTSIKSTPHPPPQNAHSAYDEEPSHNPSAAKQLHYYECPLYRTAERRGVLLTTGHSSNFVTSVSLPISDTLLPDHLTIRGVALLCSPPVV